MEATPATKAPAGGDRITSLDQFRGYTVVGMLLVNFVGGYTVVPAILKHHNVYCSYADTIMPQFFFAVGFAYRLTFLRRLERLGPVAATAAVWRRNLGLILLGFVIYHLDGGVKTWAQLESLGFLGFVKAAFGRNLFQTLVHIALTSLWVLPVIAAGAPARIAFLVASALLHVRLSTHFYFDWVWSRPGIDGGPLGFLSWTIPLLVGSLAYDLVAGRRALKAMRLASWGITLMATGYGLSCLHGALSAPPFVPPSGPVTVFTMSQRAGSVSYLTFGAGFSLALYALFVVACDRQGWQSRLFGLFGRNALAAYILHPLVAGAVKPYVPRDAPLWYVAAAFGLYFAINVLFINHLDRTGVHLRL